MLIVYVAVIVLTGMLAKDVLDVQTVNTIQSTLDLPTAVALVAFSILSIKLEFERPKYRNLQKNRGTIDMILLAGGSLLTLGLICLKYLI